jgi:threonine dehydratase
MHEKIKEAYQRIKPHIRKTPLELSAALSAITGANAYHKLECQQTSGSFKLRGALNKVLSVDESEYHKPFIAASTGNHAAGFAYAVNKIGVKGKVFMPTTASKAKLQALKPYGIEVELFGDDCAITENHTSQYARENECVLVHPYNDEHIIAGQGTIAIELLEELENIDAIFIPIGGGGLISGIASYIKAVSPNTKIIGCQPENDAHMFKSIQAGRILDPEGLPTLSDATAGGMEKDSITFDICREHVDDYVILNEKEIGEAILFLMKNQYMMVEGGAALSTAALLKSGKAYEGKNVVCIVSGKKISYEVVQKLISEDESGH